MKYQTKYNRLSRRYTIVDTAANQTIAAGLTKPEAEYFASRFNLRAAGGI